MNYSLFSFTIYLDLKEIIIKFFNILKNNIISVELAKVLGYVVVWGHGDQHTIHWMPFITQL
jgi:hypothetical protein